MLRAFATAAIGKSEKGKTMKVQLWIMLVAGVLCCAQAQAQRMYRCGNQYQDTPCSGGQKSQTVNTSGAGKSAEQTSSDPECAQRGAAAQKMMVMREAGVTRDKQLADVDAKGLGATERNLIMSVYNKRGSIPEVRVAIEKECAVEKERAAQALALRQAAAALDPKSGAQPASAGSAAQPNSAGNAASVPVEAGASTTASAAATAKKAQCDGFTSQLEGIRNSQRASGSSSQMEALNERRRGIESQQRAAGC